MKTRLLLAMFVMLSSLASSGCGYHLATTELDRRLKEQAPIGPTEKVSHTSSETEFDDDEAETSSTTRTYCERDYVEVHEVKKKRYWSNISTGYYIAGTVLGATAAAYGLKLAGVADFGEANKPQQDKLLTISFSGGTIATFAAAIFSDTAYERPAPPDPSVYVEEERVTETRKVACPF